ncbi:hypothetical protein [Flavobacterium cerinum]|uniref:Phage protein n=1 Tax=Flavobacterium cerinum TaxID=2502784 RepID=A0ABY5IQR6_9FLAO|nr:hypothetical protein [Flavobacterium cerinum]UUC45195.1 hypothetical protein NOX80_16410 [Flavobacterium cerinum]
MDSSASSLLELKNSWKDFVEDCKIGYCESIYEFDYDLKIREELQEFILSDNFFGLNYKDEIVKEINMIDSEFVEILNFTDSNDSNLPFWRRKKVLKYAGQYYATDVLNIFGIKILTVE